MSDSAALCSPQLNEVMQSLPDYTAYDDATACYEHESPYRIAVGRRLKDWGEALLDVAEYQGAYLRGHHLRTLSLLVESISDTFSLLNCHGPLQPPTENPVWLRGIREIDTRILRLLEESDQLAAPVQRGQLAVDWIEEQSEAFFRKLYALRQEIIERNRWLGLPTTTVPPLAAGAWTHPSADQKG